MSGALDLLDRRILGAFRVRDPLGRPAGQRLLASAEGLDLYEKRPGEWVVTRADALPGYDTAFTAQPGGTAIGSVAARVSLKAFEGDCLSRDFTLSLPRDPDPANRANANSLFRWHEVTMPFAPTAALPSMAAAALVSVTRQADGFLVEGALVRMRPSGNRGEAIGVTNASGEALLAVQNVPLANSGGGATVTTDLDAAIDVIVDPDTARFADPAQLVAAQRSALARMSGFADPDDIAVRLSGSASAPKTIAIAAGQTRTASLVWSAP